MDDIYVLVTFNIEYTVFCERIQCQMLTFNRQIAQILRLTMRSHVKFDRTVNGDTVQNRRSFTFLFVFKTTEQTLKYPVKMKQL